MVKSEVTTDLLINKFPILMQHISKKADLVVFVTGYGKSLDKYLGVTLRTNNEEHFHRAIGEWDVTSLEPFHGHITLVNS